MPERLEICLTGTYVCNSERETLEIDKMSKKIHQFQMWQITYVTNAMVKSGIKTCTLS